MLDRTLKSQTPVRPRTLLGFMGLGGIDFSLGGSVRSGVCRVSTGDCDWWQMERALEALYTLPEDLARTTRDWSRGDEESGRGVSLFCTGRDLPSSEIVLGRCSALFE